MKFNPIVGFANMKTLLSIGLLCILAMSLTGCWVGSGPQACANMPEPKGESAAKASLKRFLQYAGQTRAPLAGPSGTLDPAKLEHISDGDLVYDGKSSAGASTYNFHLSWAPQAKFTATVSADCSTTNNWTIG